VKFLASTEAWTVSSSLNVAIGLVALKFSSTVFEMVTDKTSASCGLVSGTVVVGAVSSPVLSDALVFPILK